MKVSTSITALSYDNRLASTFYGSYSVSLSDNYEIEAFRPPRLGETIVKLDYSIGIAAWAYTDREPRLILKEVEQKEKDMDITKFSFQQPPLTVKDVYGTNNIQIPLDSEVVEFRPPLIGDKFLAHTRTVNTTSYNYPAVSPRLILRCKPKPKPKRYSIVLEEYSEEPGAGQDYMLINFPGQTRLLSLKTTNGGSLNLKLVATTELLSSSVEPF